MYITLEFATISSVFERMLELAFPVLVVQSKAHEIIESLPSMSGSVTRIQLTLPSSNRNSNFIIAHFTFYHRINQLSTHTKIRYILSSLPQLTLASTAITNKAQVALKVRQPIAMTVVCYLVRTAKILVKSKTSNEGKVGAYSGATEADRDYLDEMCEYWHWQNVREWHRRVAISTKYLA